MGPTEFSLRQLRIAQRFARSPLGHCWTSGELLENASTGHASRYYLQRPSQIGFKTASVGFTGKGIVDEGGSYFFLPRLHLSAELSLTDEVAMATSRFGQRSSSTHARVSNCGAAGGRGGWGRGGEEKKQKTTGSCLKTFLVARDAQSAAAAGFASKNMLM